MSRKQLKWILLLAAPVVLIALPFTGAFNFRKIVKTIILQPQKTGITTFHYFDNQRNRPVVTEVWYPVDQTVPARASPGLWLRCDEARDAPLSTKMEKYPLIVMSHGSGGDRFNISWLAEVLTANGYIVAAMDHYGNTWNNKIPEYFAQPWERPLDVSFVLNQLLTSSHFKDRIDVKRIGFAGYSLGGATGIWLAGAKASNINAEQVKRICGKDLADIASSDILDKIDYSPVRHSYHDKRISAMVVMAPALGWIFEEKSLEKIRIPIMIIAPEKDEVVPFEHNAKIFAKNISRASLRMLSGEANHYVFLNRATLLGKRVVESRYCNDHLSIDRKKIHEDLSKNAVLFFNDHLR